MLGLGTTGLLLKSVITGLPLLGLALVGGILFERVLVGPIWNLAMRFASAPALTLESCVTEEATAVTAFDANGQGLVAVELDGQVIQVLGTLQSQDRAAGVRVRAGDRVRIEEVNSERNRCTVSAM
jgi:translation initiation factor IF-1